MDWHTRSPFVQVVALGGVPHRDAAQRRKEQLASLRTWKGWHQSSMLLSRSPYPMGTQSSRASSRASAASLLSAARRKTATHQAAPSGGISQYETKAGVRPPHSAYPITAAATRTTSSTQDHTNTFGGKSRLRRAANAALWGRASVPGYAGRCCCEVRCPGWGRVVISGQDAAKDLFGIAGPISVVSADSQRWNLPLSRGDDAQALCPRGDLNTDDPRVGQ
jgi:hypothetical protein